MSRNRHIPGQMSVPMSASMSVSCNLKDSQVKCLCCVTGQIPRSNVWVARLGRCPGQMSALHNWADSQVKCLRCTTGQIPRSRTCLVNPGRSGHAMVLSWTAHIRSSHTAAQSLGQMSVSCSWAVQLGLVATWHTHTYIPSTQQL